MDLLSSPETLAQEKSFERTNPLYPDDPSLQPGLFDEAWKGPAYGVAAGVTNFANLYNQIKGLYKRPLYQAIDQALGTDTQDVARRQTENLQDAAQAAGELGSGTMGAVGRIGKSVTQMVTEGGLSAALGMPMPLGIGAAEGLRGYEEMRNAGVDKQSARTLGGLSGVSAGAMALLPGSLGIKALVPDLAATIGVNTGLGMGERAVRSAYLERAGYPDMAKQYKAFDGEAMTADAILSGFFHGAARFNDYRGVNTALQVKQGRHADTDTAPGIPATPEAFGAHLDAMEETEAAMREGREPDYDSTGIHDQPFVVDPEAVRQHEEITGAVNQQISDEVGNLSAAYDQVKADHFGVADDPLVLIKPDDIESVVVARGGWKGMGDLEVKGSGWGIAKFIWRHGENSNESEQFKVKKDDLLAFPKVIREFKPSREADGNLGREWRVNLPDAEGNDRTVVFADNNLSGREGKHLVTVYISDPSKETGKALSEKKTGSPESLNMILESLPQDTASGVLARKSQGEPAIDRLPQQSKSSIEIRAAEQALNYHPDLMIGNDETGQTRLAADVLAEHDTEIAQADELAKLMDVAATCDLRTGL